MTRTLAYWKNGRLKDGVNRKILYFLICIVYILVIAMFLQTSPDGMASAAEAVHSYLNPIEDIELTVSKNLQDGNNYVFIKSQDD